MRLKKSPKLLVHYLVHWIIHNKLYFRIPSFNRSNINLLIKTIVSVILLIYLYSIINFSALLLVYQNSNYYFFLYSCLIIVTIELLIVFRLKNLLNVLSTKFSIYYLLKVSLISKFYALFLPTGLGYGIVRWYKITKNTDHKFDFFILTLIEKIVFLITVILILGLSVFFLQNIIIREFQLQSLYLVPLLLGMLVMLYLIISPNTNNWINRKKIFKRFRLNSFKTRWDLILGSFSYTLIIQTLIVLRIILLFYSVDLSMPFLDMVFVATLVFTIQALPLSIAGIGIRELAFVSIFSLYGIEPEVGVLVGLLFFIQMIIIACIGAIIEFTTRLNNS